MLLKQWAREQKISYWTALRWFHAGRMPVKAVQTATGSILVLAGDEVTESATEKSGVYLYARVSSHDQKEDLQRQLQRLRDYCAATGLIVSGEVAEIGSGLNGDRKGLAKLLRRATGNIIVEHRDRLARFGVQYIEEALAARGRSLTVINTTEDKHELVQDFVDVVTCMCARIYGQRSAANKAAKALAATKED